MLWILAHLHPMLRLNILQNEGQLGLVHQHLHFDMGWVIARADTDRNHPQRVILPYMKGGERRTPDRTRQDMGHCLLPHFKEIPTTDFFLGMLQMLQKPVHLQHQCKRKNV